MPLGPTTKQQLLDQVRIERAYWRELLEEIGEERLETPGVTGPWTMKDTIAHLTTWWRREVGRLASARRGERPPDHPPQSEVAIINQWVYITNRDRPVQDVIRDADAVWQEFEAQLEALPDDELFDAERFNWMEGRALGPGILADFVGHLRDEHEPLIRDWLDELNAT